MIDIRKQPALIECINVVLSVGHKVLVKREGPEIAVIAIEEQRKLIGKFDVKQTKV